jgi:hypothetical protein
MVPCSVIGCRLLLGPAFWYYVSPDKGMQLSKKRKLGGLDGSAFLVYVYVCNVQLENLSFPDNRLKEFDYPADAKNINDVYGIPSWVRDKNSVSTCAKPVEIDFGQGTVFCTVKGKTVIDSHLKDKLPCLIVLLFQWTRLCATSCLFR